MKILAICQYYEPEPVRFTDICEELVQRGHEVTVITGTPNYPMGKIYEGYQNGEKRRECIRGVRVIRCRTIPRNTGMLYRGLNYFSYALSALREVKKTKEEYDVIFVNQLSPIMMAWPGIVYKKRQNRKLVLYCLDLWPASLVSGGIKSGSLIYKLFFAISKKTYQQADKILITSRMFEHYLCEQFRIDPRRIRYLPQYAEDIFKVETEAPRKSKATIDFVFAGNVGRAQSIETIIRAANRVRADERFRWHIVGDGTDLDRCRELTTKLGLSSVIFHGRKPLEEMPRFYEMADAMLITLTKDSTISYTLPGKVQTYMASGKVILSAADGETRKIIEDAQCGITAKAEDDVDLARAVHLFSQCHNRDQMQTNARHYFEKNFSKEVFFDTLCTALQQEAIVGGQSR